MRRASAPAVLAALLPALLPALLSATACTYREIRYELAIEDPPPGGGGIQQAKVVDLNQQRQLQAEKIHWRYDGVLGPGPRPGTFTATGPGTGSIEAEFITPDGSRSMAIGLAVGPRPGRPAVKRRATPEPVAIANPAIEPALPPLPTPTLEPPTATPEPPGPTPPPTPPPLPVAQAPQDGDRVLEAYRLSGQGKFAAALDELAAIRDPGFGPKVQSLTRQWAPQAAVELAAEAERLAAGGKPGEALAAARRGLGLSPSAAVRRRLEAVEARLAR